MSKSIDELLSLLESRDERTQEERMATNTVDICFALREFGYVPHKTCRVFGETLEFISYPSMSNRGLVIMVSKPGDPRSVREMVLPPHVFRVLFQHRPNLKG